MSQSLLLSLLASLVSAGHVHARPQHQHDARQVSMVPVFTQPQMATPIIAPAPANTGIGALANELDSCLAKIPNDITALMAAIDQRLQDVQSQVNSILNGNIPTTSVPIITPTPYIPSSIPTFAATPPALSVPSSISVSSFAVPPLSTSVPSFVVPPLSTSVPSFVVPSPSTSVPSFVVPPSSLLSLATPSIPRSSIATPSLSISPITTPGLPIVSFPSISTPSISIATSIPVSASLITPSSVPISLSLFSLPSPSLPTTSVPPFSVPVFSMPSPSLPTTSVAPFSGPGFSFPQPTVQFVPPISPSVSAPSIQTPSISIPSVTLPSIAASGNSQQLSVPSLPVSSILSQLSSALSAATATTNTRIPVSQTTAIPTQFINTIPMNFTTVTDVASSTRLLSVSIPSATPYVFNADARDNLAVYYGNTPATASGGLVELCTNRNVDIVVLSFVFDFFSQNGYPSTYFGTSSCAGQTAAQAARAPGLRDCSPLAREISLCQAVGKKVLVSLGGYVANSSFTSPLEARSFAVTLWNLFGAGKQDTDLRPFGSNVIVDGFDIDNEDGSTTYWDSFASSMRALFNSDPSKPYYLSAAPQCPYPDASIPLSALQQTNFVWTQFYNNPSCNLDSPGFLSSFTTWSRSLSNGTSAIKPKLYIGAPAFPGAGSGYINSSALSSTISSAKGLLSGNFGGIMLWDGSEALTNTDSLGHTYLDYSKWSLEY